MTNYRRALVQEKGGGHAWQAQWYFDETCDDFPSRNFAARRERPLDGDLCTICQGLSAGSLRRQSVGS